MGWIHAAWIIALVANNAPCGDSPIVQFIREAVRKHLGQKSASAEHAVTFVVFIGSPLPALGFRGYADFLPKSSFRFNSLTHVYDYTSSGWQSKRSALAIGKKAPKAPDPSLMIDAQRKANQINQYTPYGNMEYGTIGEDGQFVRNTGDDQFASQVSETPSQRVRRIEQNRLAEGLLKGYQPSQIQGATLGTLPSNRTAAGIEATLSPFQDLNRVGQGLQEFRDPNSLARGVPGISGDYSKDASRVEQATFDRSRSLLDPIFSDQRRSTLSMLSDRGLPTGGEAFSNELTRMENSQGNQYTNAANDAVMAGRAEQNRLAQLDMQRRGQLFGENSTMAQLAANQRGQQFGEQTGVYNLGAQQRAQQFSEQQTLADIIDRRRQMDADNQARNAQLMLGQNMQNFNQQQALTGGMPISPQFQNQPQIDAMAPYMNQYNQQMAQYNSNNQGMGSLLGTGLMAGATFFSDARLKTDIVKVGEIDGVNAYEFSYHGSPARFRGVMAQEVRHIPGAVIEMPNGFLAVDYSKVPVAFEGVA